MGPWEPGKLLSQKLHVSSNAQTILTAKSWHPHFPEEETEARRGRKSSHKARERKAGRVLRSADLTALARPWCPAGAPGSVVRKKMQIARCRSLEGIQREKQGQRRGYLSVGIKEASGRDGIRFERFFMQKFMCQGMPAPRERRVGGGGKGRELRGKTPRSGPACGGSSGTAA